MTIKHSIIFFCLAVSSTSAMAESAFLPQNDNFVVSKSYISKPIDASIQKEGYSTYSLDEAINKATFYIEQAKTNNDPRYYGFAETSVRPWWNTEKSTEFRLIKSRILQFKHEFSAANDELDAILAREKNNTYATLLRANNHLALGNYPLAFKDCGAILLKTSPVITTACIMAIQGYRADQYQAEKMVSNLLKALSQSPNVSKAEWDWAVSVALEIALARGFTNSIPETVLDDVKNSNNEELIIQYLDILLEQNRLQQLIDFASTQTPSVAVLTRKVLALAKSGNIDLKNSSALLYQQMNAQKLRDENASLYEKTLLAVTLDEDLNSALELAKRNFKLFETIQNAKILFAIARKTENRNVLQKVSNWQLKNGFDIRFDTSSLTL